MNNTPDPERRLLELIVQTRLEQPDSADVAELQALLQAPRLRRLYITVVNLEGQLQSLHTQRAAEEPSPQADFDEIVLALRQAEDAAPDIAPARVTLQEPTEQHQDTGSLSMHDFAVVGGYVLRKFFTNKKVIATGITTAAAAVLLLTLILINPFASDTPPRKTSQTTPQLSPPSRRSRFCGITPEAPPSPP